MEFNIPDLMSQLKLSAADIGKLYPFQEQIAQMREISKNFFTFVNKLLTKNLGLTRKEAAMAYRASKFFPVREQMVLGMRPEDIPAPELATVLQFGPGPWQNRGEYRYDVVVTINFGGPANERDFPVQVFTRTPVSLADAQNQAIWKVLLEFDPKSMPPEYGGTNKVMSIATKLEGFNRILVK